jgi:hypothetical protein
MARYLYVSLTLAIFLLSDLTSIYIGTDLRFTPHNGTAPYTLLIAPAFHPPINITSSTSSPMNYTVRLSHGQAFMAGVYDSAGNSFAIGPFHAGASTDLGCLATTPGQSWKSTSSGKITLFAAMAGSILGGLLVGALGALLLKWVMNRKKNKGRLVSLITSDTRRN